MTTVASPPIPPSPLESKNKPEIVAAGRRLLTTAAQTKLGTRDAAMMSTTPASTS